MAKFKDECSTKVTLTLPYRTVERIDKKREDISRSRFVLRLIEKNFKDGDGY